MSLYNLAGVAVGWPNTFNAVHMALIPKGRYRGMVLAWNIYPLLANQPPQFGSTSAGQYVSFQPYSIIDPANTPTVTDPLPTGNQAFRFRNFLLPMSVPFAPDPATVSPDGWTLFCAGHAWSPHGDLVVAGGTKFNVVIPQTTPATPLYNGDPRTFVFNPRFPTDYSGTGSQLYPGFMGYWTAGPNMNQRRWYPTVTMSNRLQTRVTTAFPDPREAMVILGGSYDNGGGGASGNPTWNSYEAVLVNAESNPSAPVSQRSGLVNDSYLGNALWTGPGSGGTPPPVNVDWLEEYPRCHLLSNGSVFFSGYAPRFGAVDHDNNPGLWVTDNGTPTGAFSAVWDHPRHDGSSILFPNIGGRHDVIMRLGGSDENQFGVTPLGTTDSVESIDMQATNPKWVAEPSMPIHPNGLDGGRFLSNAVILPTGAVLVVGGSHRTPNSTANTQVYDPILFENGAWTTLSSNTTPSVRDYHSTAVLLPDGRVFVGGGNDRTYDYEIFSPPYLQLPANHKPTNVAFQTWPPAPQLNTTLDAYELHYGQTYRIECSPIGALGVTLDRAVLMAPCSITHHSDMSQRYYEMTPFDANHKPYAFDFVAPPDDKHAPRGIYMLFLITTSGAISDAIWTVLR